MTDITHEALIERGWKKIAGTYFYDFNSSSGLHYDMNNELLWIMQGRELIKVTNTPTLADLDNLIKLFV